MFALARLACAAVLCLGPWVRGEEVALCVRVRIEIEQELTLERQGFEARMNIGNGGTAALENLTAVVNFTDKDGNPVVATSNPNDTSAKFFIRLTSSATLPSQVAAGAEQKLRWLIIPSPGAAGASQVGTLYFVGATLGYRTGGQDTTVEVTPDSITVKPMPDLTLDYFLPNEVYGDDPFTPQIEAAIPFSLGVRVQNNGFGIARNLKIDSGQPKIVDNQQGLLINFHLEGSEVNGMPATASLLSIFGDIQPGRSSIGRWIMTSSLYGKFVEFNATFSHSDELGGQLTSLITGVRTHLLVHDVLVDLPGRDSVRDFLALEGDALRVYESDNLDAPVVNASSASQIAASGTSWTVTAPEWIGFGYLKLPDPLSGNKVIRSVTRSDGKAIDSNNAWLSRTFLVESRQWNYFLNIFDLNHPAGASYSVVFGNAVQGNRPPVLQQPAERVVRVGTYVGMAVQASDPDGTPVTLAGSLLPAGAAFTDSGNGHGIFSWTPTATQLGDFPLQFSASDGLLVTRKTAVVTVTSAAGILLDQWKERFWPGLTNQNIIGNAADPDQDGLNNGVEYALNLDPTKPGESGLVVGVEENAGGDLVTTMTYVRRTDDPTLRVEVVGASSSRMSANTWQTQPQAPAADQSEVPDGMQRWKAVDSVPLKGEVQRRFLEVRASFQN